MNRSTLLARPLGRTGRTAPPLIWRLRDQCPDAAALAEAGIAGASWVYVDAAASDSLLRTIGQVLPRDAELLLGVEAEALAPRRGAAVTDRLLLLRRQSCSGVVLQGASSGDVKAGTPFHRLGQLRDRGHIGFFAVEATEYATAEWMLNHSPAHAIVLPFGIDNQSARYRMIESAREMGTALLGTVQTSSIEREVSFGVAQEGLSAVVVDWPATAADMRAIIESALHPMPPDQANAIWAQYQQRVPPPPEPVRGVPPEFA